MSRTKSEMPRVREWILRSARREDMAAAKALLEASALPAEDLAGQFGENYVVAERDGVVIGMAGVEVHRSHGLLRSVAVAMRFRGSGLGGEMVHDRIAWAKAHGIESMYLLTTGADRYFVRHGFVSVLRSDAPDEIRASRQFTELCPETAKLMRYEATGVDANAIRDHVKQYYGRAAHEAYSGRNACCGGACDPATSAITSDLYEARELDGIPEEAVRASLGCGNPALLAELREGETVLDLGSGGGIDVLLSARRVGPTGKAYGIDMTEPMLALARSNQRKAGVENVEFLKGEIEHMPLPSASVDVIISNCVINLSADKRRVLQEAFRVLKPGGRFAVSDVVVRREIPAEVRRSAELWAGCIAGALEESTYRDLLRDAGFENIEMVPTRIYSAEDAGILSGDIKLDEASVKALDGAFMSAFVRANKPAKPA